PSTAEQPRLTFEPCQAPSGESQETTGAFLSILLPAIGPAVTQLPAVSQTWRASVAAFASSASVGTLVDSEKVAPPGVASPEPSSLALQARLTFPPCQTPAGASQASEGAVLSIF